MAGKRSKRGRDDALAAYRRIRKPMPPPTRTDEDRRRESLDEVERREARDAADDAVADRRTQAAPEPGHGSPPDGSG